MVRIIWSRRSVRDLEAIRLYVDQFDPDAALRLAERLFALGESLQNFPDRGTPVENGERQLSSVWPYRLRYRVRGNTVEIIGIRHGARLWTDSGSDAGNPT